ncbi:MAG: hypothetical protein ABI867_20445 [Kofleriaceae bacterium]
MPHAFEAIPEAQLITVAGGIDIGGLATSIGGLVDKFAGTGGKATQIAQQIGGIASSFMGGGAGGGGAAAAPQQ